MFTVSSHLRLANIHTILIRGRILGPNRGKSLKSFPPCYSQSPVPTDLLLHKSGLKLVCNVNVVHGNLKSENSQDYAQKPQQNCTFMNSASALRSRKSPDTSLPLRVLYSIDG